SRTIRTGGTTSSSTSTSTATTAPASAPATRQAGRERSPASCISSGRSSLSTIWNAATLATPKRPHRVRVVRPRETSGAPAGKAAWCGNNHWKRDQAMNVLVVDVGGTHVKILATGQEERREFPSGPALTAEQMVRGVKELAGDWKYDAVSIGYPGPVPHGWPVAEPHNLAPGWVRFDFGAAFGCPVKVINDAAMQALGSYKGGKMLFLGLGTGLGSAMILEGIIEPMELGHLPYKKGTYEDYVGIRGLDQHGKKKWREYVAD